MAGTYQPITVSRRISAPAREIFQLLADPREHLNLDGSGMLRGVTSGTVISGLGRTLERLDQLCARPQQLRNSRS